MFFHRKEKRLQFNTSSMEVIHKPKHPYPPRVQEIDIMIHQPIYFIIIFSYRLVKKMENGHQAPLENRCKQSDPWVSELYSEHDRRLSKWIWSPAIHLEPQHPFVSLQKNIPKTSKSNRQRSNSSCWGQGSHAGGTDSVDRKPPSGDGQLLTLF